MKLILDGHSLGYEMGNLCFLFFPGERVEQLPPQKELSGDFAVTRIRVRKSKACALVLLSRGGRKCASLEYFDKGAPGFEKRSELALGRAFYRAASEICGFRPPWGVLTGIRPVKLIREKTASGMSGDEARRWLERKCYVSAGKSALCLETAASEDRITALSRLESFSLYISVPFCPSRCAYCSFVSQEIEKAAKLLPDYVELLCGEIAETGRIASHLGLRLETVYMGGGTPTTLNSRQLTQIFKAVEKSFNTGTLREYTVEAGRPDTITEEKLRAILAAGAGRISINPQTMNDTILESIGRRHTAADTERAFSLAVKCGVPSVNMDVIAGLPGDTQEGYERTLRLVAGMNPQAVTVHTLAMKRASGLVTSGSAAYNAQGSLVAGMLDFSSALLHGGGYRPYYLYRQRNTAGNLENTGWSRKGQEGLYNVFIMDETHTILAVGAGGVTKI